jgi:hypothetical protein
MRIALAVVVAATACGRVGFDPLSGDAADVDGARDGAQLCPASARLCDDFETGTTALWSGVSTSPTATNTVSMTQVHGGRYALDANVPPTTMTEFSTVFLDIPLQTSGVIATRQWIFAPATLAGFDEVVGLFDKTTMTQYFVFGCDNNANWTATERSAISGIDDHIGTTPCVTNVWTCVELVYSFETRHALMYIDSALVLDAMVQDPSPRFNDIEVGVVRANMVGFHLYVDDVIIADQRIGCQ